MNVVRSISRRPSKIGGEPVARYSGESCPDEPTYRMLGYLVEARRRACCRLRRSRARRWSVRIGCRSVLSCALPKRRNLAAHPNSYIAAGRWPGGPLRHNAPPEAHLARAMSLRLRTAAASWVLTELARTAGISEAVLYNVLNGSTWGDVVTVARLERALGMTLWGDEHLSERPQGS